MTTVWKIRRADTQDAGRELSWEQLTQAVENGLIGEDNQVLGPSDPAWKLVGDHPAMEEFLPTVPMFRRSQLEEAEMDMTPMIDVTFQLLIFFMIAATYMVQKTLDMPKPDQDQDAPPGVTMQELQANNVMIGLKADGSLTVQGKPVTLEELEATLTQVVSQERKSEAVLDASPDVSHETVVKVLDAAAGAQIERVHFVTHAPSNTSNPNPRSPP